MSLPPSKERLSLLYSLYTVRWTYYPRDRVFSKANGSPLDSARRPLGTWERSAEGWPGTSMKLQRNRIKDCGVLVLGCVLSLLAFSLSRLFLAFLLNSRFLAFSFSRFLSFSLSLFPAFSLSCVPAFHCVRSAHGTLNAAIARIG